MLYTLLAVVKLNDMITWKKDEIHNTEEGWINGTMYFDIERIGSTEKVRLYQMKKPLGNCIELTNMEEAKKYCEGIKPVV